MFAVEYAAPGLTMEHLGLLPAIFHDTDPRPCAEQVNARYSHGGGWNPMRSWVATPKTRLYLAEPEVVRIEYPGDPAFRVICSWRINAERVFLFDCSWIMVVQPSGDYEVARMD
jgi:hypothetical protein